MDNLNKFIKDELALRKRHYSEDPASIIEHYNIEQQNIQAYNGRQLLEMLQNADDATGTAEKKKVLITLSEEHLTIANNGDTFTEGGFLSITRSNLSPKTMQQNKIGQKGLGFRSILSWADDITITSGGTKLGFSKAIAQRFLEDLIKDTPFVQKEINKRTKVHLPIAILRVPQLLERKRNEDQKYDTSITLKLKSETQSDVQEQINSIINKETMIFLNHIEEIEIDSPKRKALICKHISGDTITVKYTDILSNTIESKTWHLNKVWGEHNSKNYELAIAWNDELDDNENVLYSNFKTQVRFPFPALLHGTFELSQNRNQLENDTMGHNEFLTEKLAQLLVETALKIAGKDKSATYFPLRLLNIDFGRIDTILAKFNFKEKLYEMIKLSKVFPTVNGTYIDYSPKPVFYEYPIAAFLNGEDVKNLLLPIIIINEDFIKFLNSFNLYHYRLEYYLKIVSNRTNNIENLAKLIFLALTSEHYEDEITSAEFNLSTNPEFLIDTNGNKIRWTSKIFLQPNNNKIFDLPQSLDIQFVSPQLTRFLIEEFQYKSIDHLLEDLEPFQVKKYSFTEVATTLILHYKNKPELKAVDVRELHKYLFELCHNEAKEGRTLANIGIDAPVISQKLGIIPSSKAYLGEHYGNPLTERLYSFDKTKILAEPSALGLGNYEPSFLTGYLSWLGVEKFPRYILYEFRTNRNNAYVDHILRNFKYPTVKYNGWNFKSFNDFKEWLQWDVVLRLGDYDDLDKILEHAPIESIFDWLNKDDEFKKTLETDREVLDGTSFYYHKNTDRYLYKQDLPSYVKWKIIRSNFLPVISAVGKSSPERCCLSKTITLDFSPFVEKPKINFSSISEKLHLSEDLLENYLTLLGVHREISSLSIDTLYNMLLSLPTSDREGKVAKTIYREVINNFNENKLDVTYATYQSYIKNGMVLCNKGNGIGYYPIQDAYYIETKAFGKNILKRFPLICIDRKRGNKKVERLFGVKSLEHISFKVIGEPNIHCLNSRFTDEINRFKSLIYTLRIHQDTRHEIRNRLKRLKIILTSDINAEFIHNGLAEKFELEHYEFIVIKNKTTFYILISENDSSMEDLRHNISFCDSISEIFTTLINTEEYRGFIHDLYSKREIDREPRLLSELQQDTNELIIQAREQLDVIDDIRLSFWNAFLIASSQNIKLEIRNDEELNTFLQKNLKLKGSTFDRLSSIETFNQLLDLETQEFLYKVFIDFKIDFTKFLRHFSGLEFTQLFRNSFEDLKRKYKNEFAFELYSIIKTDTISLKGEFFDYLDIYDDLGYSEEFGFINDIHDFFKDYIKEESSIILEDKNKTFSYLELINESIGLLKAEGIIMPQYLYEKRKIQSLLVFRELEEVKKEIHIFISANTVNSANRIKVGKSLIEYEDYESLAERVLSEHDIHKLGFKTTGILPIEEGIRRGKITGQYRNVRFNTKTEEHIGFIAELMCYHKLCELYKTENVNWISENAYRAYPEKFLTGEAGKGYDLELTDEEEKVRFIEIKGTANIEDGIRMTKEEIRVALEYPEKYDLLIVENPMSSNPYFRYIKSPFKFRSEESLFSNTKLKVYNDNYIIRFAWND